MRLKKAFLTRLDSYKEDIMSQSNGQTVTTTTKPVMILTVSLEAGEFIRLCHSGHFLEVSMFTLTLMTITSQA